MSCCATCGPAFRWHRNSARQRLHGWPLLFQVSKKGEGVIGQICSAFSSQWQGTPAQQGSTFIACAHLRCRLQRMEEAASGGEQRHIALLLRPLTEAINMALTKHEAAKADALSSQP
jgi:hypothetical protein